VRLVVSEGEMRRPPAAAIKRGSPAEVLMERAGRAVARAVLRISKQRYGTRIVVVCGPGNNGGDGFVAARVLAGQGAAVCCAVVSDPSTLKGPAKMSHDRFLAAGGIAVSFDRGLLEEAVVIVDAIFGTGFHGEPEGTARDAIEAINDARARSGGGTAVLSVDVPSGAGGGGRAVHSDVTVALAAEKLETASRDREVSGQVVVADIGIEVASPGAHMAEPEDMLGVAQRDPNAHKWSQAVMILAGADGMTGAAALCARGAFRAGAGYVTLGTTRGVEPVARTLVPEAVVRVAGDGGVLASAAVDELRGAIEKAGALAIGPGIGTGPEQKEMVLRVLEEVEQPVVLDADGLNVMHDDTEALASRTAPLVITPHTGELARLLGCSSEDITSDRVAAVRDAGERFGCTVLLKGPRTLTFATERGLVINPTGGSELATAGTGDVLSGVVAALAAKGTDPFTPAWQGAYLHGSAGDLAAAKAGPVGLVAWDVAEALPEAIASLSPS
jgi:ADP-dependent NAD(P)H-hydrate dehydratase / NAD(P)H-hydrate epimerase